MNDDANIPLLGSENNNLKESYQTHEIRVTEQLDPSFNVRTSFNVRQLRGLLPFDDGPGFDDFQSWSETKSALLWILFYVCIFIVLAVVGYSYLFESWPITDSIYTAVIIFTTVGYGDLCPSNDASRLFTILIGCFGITILGIFLGIMSELIMVRQEKRMEAIKDDTRTKVFAQVLGESNTEGAQKRLSATIFVSLSYNSHVSF